MGPLHHSPALSSLPSLISPSMFLPQGQSGKTQQQKDVQERELQARDHEICDLKTTVALLHARIDHQQRQTSDQVRRP